MERRLAAILAADAAGFSKFMEANEQACVETLSDFRDVIDNFIGAHGGRVFGSGGDGIVAEFQSAVEALRAAVDIQRELGMRNGPRADDRTLPYRIGLNLGDVVIDGDNLLGDGVNLAARLESLAEPGGIWLSRAVFEQVDGKVDLGFEDLGSTQVKNISKPVHVFKVVQAANAVAPDVPEHRNKPTIAVLPFDNMSGDKEQEYFSDGISEDIITALSKYRWLLVVARNSSFAFKGHATDIRRIGKELAADYVVEGSVRKAGNRVRVTCQLIEAQSGNHIWAERYDGSLEDIFQVQDEITAAITSRVEPEVGAVERQRVSKKAARDYDAWDCYHLGMAQFYKFTPETNTEAQRLMRQAIAMDPELADAHSWLAYAIVLSMVYFDAELSAENFDQALALASRAVELDDQNGLAHMLLGRTHLARCEYDDALAELRTGIQLNPCMAVGYCGLGDSLAYEGRLEESIVEFQKAITYGPHDPQRWAFFSYRALAHLFLEQFDKAVEWSQKATRVPNCQYWPFAHRVAALGYLDQPDRLAVALRELSARKPGFTRAYAKERLFYIRKQEQLALYLEGLRRAGVPEG